MVFCFVHDTIFVMDAVFFIVLFVLGLLIGSFLNVVILRYNTGQFFKKRSACFSCNQTLDWHDLIPLFSFLLLRGKCKKCKSKISIQYPLVELTTGLLFVLLGAKFFQLTLFDINSFVFAFVLYALVFCILIVISVYDIKHKIIPDAFVYAFIFLGVLSTTLTFFPTTHFEFPVWADLLGGIVAASPFFLLWLISKGKWMGFGDVKLALGIGFFLGIEKSIIALLLSFWIGALVGLILLWINKKNVTIKSEIPFGPFLVIGFALVFFLNLDLYSILNAFL